MQNGTNSTRGLSIDVNFKNNSVTLNRNLINPAELIFADSQGSYQPLEADHVLVGYGQIAKTREFNASNHVIYEAQYGYSTASSLVASYRTYRQKWSGQVSAAPKVVARCSSNVTSVYMSWNGATTYDTWTVFAGTSATNVSVVATLSKAGFESSYTFTEKYTNLFVEAKGNGKSLANSSTISTGC